MKKNAYLVEYKKFPHGFWSLDQLGLKNCDKALLQTLYYMNDLILLAKKRKTIVKIRHKTMPLSINNSFQLNIIPNYIKEVP